VNALSIGVPDAASWRPLAAAPPPGGHRLRAAGRRRTFIAGADIREFGKPRPPGAKTIFDLIAALEASPKPVVAAIHGTALGGGLELALACHWRVGVRGSQYGLPEVKLGILPGAGGTQRLPRLIGVEPAARLIVSGDFVAAEKALALGIVDALVEGDLAAAGATLARQVVAEGRPLRLVRAMNDRLAVPDGFFDGLRKSIARSGRGRGAASTASRRPPPCRSGGAGASGNSSRMPRLAAIRALRHFFFAEREVAKIPGRARDAGARGRQGGRDRRRHHGRRHRHELRQCRHPVVLVETTADALGAVSVDRANYARTVASGRQAAMDMAMA
jgi:3-hydroxyacyl-CoA dehydrogenase